MSKIKNSSAVEEFLSSQIIYKPGFVWTCVRANHLSSSAVADRLKRISL